ncbi:MAG: MFS transporter [Legionellales bacterium]|jgi:MFS family permease
MNDRMQLSRTVWALGFVSLFMDISSEMIHSLLPIFMVTQLGVSALVLGTIEGVAEAITLFMKTFSGALSDWLRKRKLLIVWGYLLAALTKPLFAFSHHLSWIIVARFTDRMGKGIRGAPRDALIADVTPPLLRGTAFGLRQSLDTWGAVIGPLLAMLGMFVFADNFHAVFMFAIIPALLSVFILMIFVKEPKTAPITEPVVWPLRKAVLKNLPRNYWWVFGLGFVFTLARFSEAFLILRAQTLGLALTYVPMVLLFMSVFYAASAYPFGKISDKVGRMRLFVLSLLLLILANVVLALSSEVWTVFIGVALWGLHLGASQGVLSALIADTSPAHLRATAFGLFSLSSGVATLLASIIAGLLWVSLGAAATFIVGGIFALITLFILGVYQHVRTS